ncbi:B12-binding domain-containing radical SAM protein [Candidatus Pyrohabitans sp.]
MRVTLVKPPEHSKLNFGSFSLAVLAAAVRDIAEVKILDATNLTIVDAVREVLKTKPELVGVTTMGLASIGPAAVFLNALRSAGFKGVLIAGGHGATMSPKALLERGADAVVYGEGELTFREVLLRGVSEYVRGLFLLRNGSLLKTPPRPLIQPLDNLPEPARDLTGSPPNGVALLETSRGCPHGCTFCAATRFHGRMWRARSPELVARDVRHLVVRHRAAIIEITDDNFTASPERALRICELLQNEPLPLFFLFSARSDDLLRHPALVPALAKAHFLRATIGVETVAPKLAQSIRKPITFEQHQRAFAALRDAGIYTVASFIVGLPGETEEIRRGCVDAAVELGADAVRFVPFQPLPGTPMERGTGEPEPWCVEAAAKFTREFERHPKVLSRLLDAAEEPTVRGMFARAGLRRRLRENILDADDAAMVAEKLGELNSESVDVEEPIRWSDCCAG